MKQKRNTAGKGRVVTSIMVGTGGMARVHMQAMLAMPTTTRIVGFVEPHEGSRDAVRAIYSEKKLTCPGFYGSIKALVKAQGPADSAVICTPHKFHFENARDCLLAGMDVLIEKPMVMTASEARRLIRLRDQTKRLLVVAFPGSLSPALQKAKQLIANGAIGKVTTISAYAHQEWKQCTTGSWRQDPAMSGGGFLFDTGSHMVNTVVELLGEPVRQVTALLDNRGTPVDIASSVTGMTKGGIVFSLAAAGDSIQCCSNVSVFGSKGVLETGIWGERLSMKTLDKPHMTPVDYPASSGPWEQFLNVRNGTRDNPCPPEVGLRFSLLMDLIRTSATTGKVARAGK